MQPNVFQIPSAEEAAAQAYNLGFRDGYARAVHEDILEIQASIRKHDEERQAIADSQGFCDSREGDEP